MQNSEPNIVDLLNSHAPGSDAIAAPGMPSMPYQDLVNQGAHVRRKLNAAGIGADECVAIVVPNGPAMAAAFLAVAGTTAAAPLNPAYKHAEFEFYLDDLKASAVIVRRGFESPAREVAANHGISVIELDEPTDAQAGAFELELAVGSGAARAPTAGDTALVLHTSGTTSRPKIVPLSHRNLLASAANIAETLRLTSTDRCLNVMPLFHIHGLVAGVLASLASGGSVACTPEFNATRFFAWVEQTAPSWYSAVPTMHQLVLARAARNQEIIKQRPLRFIRSSSASLPAPVMHKLESVFDCPVIESYGMTEAAHQMTSNPLPPAARKAGSVGIPAGPAVMLMSPTGAPVPSDEEGEIVIRGPNVTAGYANNPAANSEAFHAGDESGRWFRTGDLGVMDSDGYLRISGRIKEIINRGGEKIAPREIDDVLMEHPAVAQAVAFAVAHEKLGEDVAAVVVLQDGASVDERELKNFARKQLAGFKVPRQIVFAESIPKGPTGKLQRIGLAARLGFESEA
ncbi:MAG: acyl--CoA ligase [Pseudomonadota bacterium]